MKLGKKRRALTLQAKTYMTNDFLYLYILFVHLLILVFYKILLMQLVHILDEVAFSHIVLHHEEYS